MPKTLTDDQVGLVKRFIAAEDAHQARLAEQRRAAEAAHEAEYHKQQTRELVNDALPPGNYVVAGRLVQVVAGTGTRVLPVDDLIP